jgi:beta-galactosidase
MTVLFRHRVSVVFFWKAALLCCASIAAPAAGDDFAAPLPRGVGAVWDVEKAFHRQTPSRQRICINGLWRWQPAEGEPQKTPAGKWGYFKVPGCWPGITNYMQKDCQTVFAHESWKDRPLASLSAAWYEREVAVPAAWDGRRIALKIDYLNSLAVAFIDGKRAGELQFPGGEIDLTPLCRPGKSYTLTLHVAAVPLAGVLLSYSDSNAAREVEGRVARRGLCGDVFLIGSPAAERIVDVKVDTSVRNEGIRFTTALAALKDGASYSLHALVTQGDEAVREFESPEFKAGDLKGGKLAFTGKWLPDGLWDIHTPENTFEAALTLRRADGEALDTAQRERFGFREFWIDGKDFYLNGSRIFLSAVPLDNAQVGAALTGYKGARESLRRLKSFGINFVYTHNYGCQPGSHLGFEEILRAADDEGMLVAFSQPHFSHYDWQAPDADEKNGYARHAEYYTAAAGNHPAVVAYSMNHNACGYGGDMNPDLIDGLSDPRNSNYEMRNFRRARRAEAIVRRLDPVRIVYHHAGGNIGAMHTVNFYPNFVPIQEMSDWFEHWATVGVKPAFPCEYGAPFFWDWAMYRGWYKGERVFGSAEVPWDFCMAEWNAQFLGDTAYKITEYEKANLRWEAEQYREGRLWHRWDYPQILGSNVFDDRYLVVARYLTDNWRSFRTWGLSGVTPWQHGHYWKLKKGAATGRRELPVDWENLQRPGFSADYLGERYERRDLAYEQDDWEPTPAAEALLRNNMPRLAWIAGKPAAFTSKDHLFTPGETFEKQAIVINNSRRPVECDCAWSLALPEPVSGGKRVSVPTGEQVRIPLSFELPETIEPGTYELKAEFKFSSGETQEDSFIVHVLPQPEKPRIGGRIVLFDPRGETAAQLEAAGVRVEMIDADDDLAGYDVLIVGKAALTVDGPAPNIARVPDGLRVVMFEQTADVLEKRFGFRTAQYGLRWVFPRVPDHPLLAGLKEEHLRDWRGAATILAPRLEYTMRPRHGPTVRWCGMEVSRLWRCGNRGNVASVLIEKPACGDFRPIVDGGFSLQYSPLLEHRDGRGMILFCQLDVTGRSEPDPAAETLLRNVLAYASSWKPSPRRAVVYVGEEAGRRHLAAAGFAVEPYDGELKKAQVLVVGPGGGESLTKDAKPIAEWLAGGGKLLAVGLDQEDVAFLPAKIGIKRAEHIAAYFEASSADSPLSGVCPADVHNRDPRRLPLVSEGATIVDDGVLAVSESKNIVFCQLAPWQFDDTAQQNLKKTYRRTSFLLTRLLANLGAETTTPIVDRFGTPCDGESPPRWQTGLYLDRPEEWDDPYRFFRW